MELIICHIILILLVVSVIWNVWCMEQLIDNECIPQLSGILLWNLNIFVE